jgi:C2 domain
MQARETYDAARQVSVSVTTGESQALLNVTVISARHLPRAARRAAADTYVALQLLHCTDATAGTATAAAAGTSNGSGVYSSSSRRRRSSANSSSTTTTTTATTAATTVRADTLYPEWRETFELRPVPDRKHTRLGMSLMDALTDTAIGSSTFPLSDPALTPGKPVTIWLELQTPDSAVGLLKSSNRACRLPEGCAVKCELTLRCNAGLAAAAAVAKLAAAVRCEGSAVAARRDYDASQQQQQQQQYGAEPCSDVYSQHSDAHSDEHNSELLTDSTASVAAGGACDTVEQQQQQHVLLQGSDAHAVQHSASNESGESPQVHEVAEHCNNEHGTGSSVAADSNLAQQQQQQQQEAVAAENTPAKERQRAHSASAQHHRNSVSSSSSSLTVAAAAAATAVSSSGHSVASKGSRTPRAGAHNNAAASSCNLDSSSSSYNSSIFRSPAARWSKTTTAKRSNSSADTIPWR